jgi:hypothetical protein
LAALDHLVPDPYAAELGIARLRRYGRYVVGDEVLRAPAEAFVQPERSNPLYIGRDREGEPPTAAFAGDPVLGSLLQLLRRVATALDDVTG